MKNTTVKELIEILQTMNPDALVCSMEANGPDYEPAFSTFEICKEFPNVKYIDDIGDFKTGDVVAIY